MPSLHLPTLRALKTAEHVLDLLQAGQLDGETLTVSRDDWERIGAKYARPRKSLGDAVNGLNAKRRECYDEAGNLIPGSPCAKRAQA